MSLDIFYKENKYKMTILFFCRRIGKMIMKILPDCSFFNILENRQTMTNFSIDKMYIKYFVQILHICTSSPSFLESFFWFSWYCYILPAVWKLAEPRDCVVSTLNRGNRGVVFRRQTAGNFERKMMHFFSGWNMWTLFCRFLISSLRWVSSERCQDLSSQNLLHMRILRRHFSVGNFAHISEHFARRKTHLWRSIL